MVLFESPTLVKVKDIVLVEEYCFFDVDGPKVSFYSGDNCKF